MSVKRTLINILLVLLYAMLSIAVVRPFLADMFFNAGKYALALQLDSHSAERHATTGSIYAEMAAAHKQGIPVLLKAEGEYRQAVDLNSHSVLYLIEFAEIEKNIFLTDPAAYRDRLSNASRYLRGAFYIDPNNYIVNYRIGRDFLELWLYIRNEDKEFAVERFKSCLALASWYYEAVYQILWRRVGNFDILRAVTPENLTAYENLYSFVVKNNLWKYRKEVINKLKEYKKGNNPVFVAPEGAESAWYGKSDNGDNVYKNGSMYWSGTISRIIEIPKGRCLIKIRAKGDKAYGTWPYMIVELDGEEIGERPVNGDEWREYGFDVNTTGGAKVLSVIFPNDVGNPAKGIDRNLYLGDVEVERYE